MEFQSNFVFLRPSKVRKLVCTNQFQVKSTKMGTRRKFVTLQYNENNSVTIEALSRLRLVKISHLGGGKMWNFRKLPPGPRCEVYSIFKTPNWARPWCTWLVLLCKTYLKPSLYIVHNSAGPDSFSNWVFSSHFRLIVSREMMIPGRSSSFLTNWQKFPLPNE